MNSIAFVLGNGISRKKISLDRLKKLGTIYGCNALYREFEPDYLVAMDDRMILEINESGYQNDHIVWSNKTSKVTNIKNINWFSPNLVSNSGPAAASLAVKHSHTMIYLIGFDMDSRRGRVNNIYAGTRNYKKKTDGGGGYIKTAKDLRKLAIENPSVTFIRVIKTGGFCPKELNKIDNFSTIHLKNFEILLLDM